MLIISLSFVNIWWLYSLASLTPHLSFFCVMYLGTIFRPQKFHCYRVSSRLLKKNVHFQLTGGGAWHHLGNYSLSNFFSFILHFPEILGTNCNYFKLTNSSRFTCIPAPMSSLQTSASPSIAARSKAVKLLYRKQYIKITENRETVSFLLPSLMRVKSLGKNSIVLPMSMKHDWQCYCQISKVVDHLGEKFKFFRPLGLEIQSASDHKTSKN